MCGLDLSQFAKYWMIPGHKADIKLSTVPLEVTLVQTGFLLEFGSLTHLKSVFFYSCGTINFFIFYQVFTIFTAYTVYTIETALGNLSFTF